MEIMRKLFVICGDESSLTDEQRGESSLVIMGSYVLTSGILLGESTDTDK